MNNSIDSSSRLVADLALLATACFWGVNILVVKFAIEFVEPLVFNAIRMVLSALTLGLLAWIEYRYQALQNQRKPSLGDWIPRKNWPRILAFSACSGLLYPLLFMFGIERATAANTALLMASMPMWTAILSFCFLHERLKKITWIGLFLTLCGTALVTSAKGQIDLSSAYITGNILILAAAAVWASATVVSRPLMHSVSPLLLAFLSAAITVPLHLLIVAPQIKESLPQFASTGMLLAVIYSGVCSTGIAYATWNLGVHRLGGSHAAVYQNVVTLVAVLGGWFVLGEAPLMAQIVGGLVTIAGLLIMRQGR